MVHAGADLGRGRVHRVRLAAIEVLSEAPEGTATASQPLLNALEDDDGRVRNSAADAIAILLSRTDLKQKLTLCRIVAQNTANQNAIGTGCSIGAKYMSLEVRLPV
jgi:HEAT repeat protein